MAPEQQKEPWLKFFHTDWQADEAVQMCSLAARGLWFELICYMHKATPYGHLVINGRVPTDEELFRRVRPKSKREFVDAMAEIRDNGVCSLTADGVMYCRRMVRRADRVTASRENGQRGGRPKKAGNENLDRNLDENLSRNLEKTPRSQKLEARSQKLDHGGVRSKQILFRGQRLIVFQWFFERAEKILGKHLNSFGLDEWFDTVDGAAAQSDEVIPSRDSGAWLEAQLVAEARKRGLPIAEAGTKKSSEEDPYSRMPRAWTCRECGQVHEGTEEQRRRGVCLKTVS